MNEYAIVGFTCVLLTPVVWAVSTHNKFARLDAIIDESWANVDVALNLRHDLIPNLLEAVRAISKHECQIVDRLIDAHQNAIVGQAQSESILANSVSAVLSLAQTYPELRASQNFIELQHQLSNTEDRIAAAKRFYNANVRELNMLIESFPAKLVSGGRKPREFFEAESVRVRPVPDERA